MKIITWNINGYRSTDQNKLFQPILDLKADIICLQEIKLNEDLINVKEYNTYYNFANKKGYSGVAILTKKKPININQEIGFEQFDNEGRLLLLEFDNFNLINLYVPHGGREKENISYKLKSLDYIINYLKEHNNKRTIICTDFNIAHEEIDLARPLSNYDNIMFTQEERMKVDELLKIKFLDSLRVMTKETGIYSWWPYAFNARIRNIGWRIDYIFVSREFENNIKEVKYLNDYYGSDHCPILIEVGII